MKDRQRIAVFSCAIALCAVGAWGGEKPLRMQVSPAISRAPAMLTVRVTVEAAAENRRLQVVAESPTFFRSSEVQLEGANSSPLNVFEFRNLPTGLYEVTGLLIGTQGLRASVSGLAKVEPSVGLR